MSNESNFVVYDKGNGAIVSAGSGVRNSVIPSGNCDVLWGQYADPDTHRVDLLSLTIIERQTFDDGEWQGDNYVVNVPAGTQAIWQGQVLTLSDETVAVPVNMPGSYSLTLVHPIYFRRSYQLANPQLN